MKTKMFNLFLTLILLVNSFMLSTRIVELEETVASLKNVISALVTNEGKIVDILKEHTNKAKAVEVHKEQRIILEKHQIDEMQLNKYTNLHVKVNLTEQDINLIIDDWNKYVKGGTPFKGKGAVFIQASKATGLDPVYLLAHAAWETGWGRSQIAKEHRNYYGIAAYDRNPGNAYVMGNTIDEGIINGAKWIKANYYDQGLKSLNSMIYGGKMYASDKDKWISGISSIMIESYKILIRV